MYHTESKLMIAIYLVILEGKGSMEGIMEDTK